MSIESFNGGLGSGKTLRLSIRMLEKYEKGYDIWCNYDLSFPHKKINPLDLIDGLFDDEIRKGKTFIGMTEAYTFLDSRFSGSESNRYIGYFILQTRKKKFEFGYDAQIIGSVDLRCRAITNRVYLCNKLVKDKEKDKEDIDNIVGFYYEVYDDDNTSFTETLEIEDALKYFKMYNTEDVLLPVYLQPVQDLDKILEIFKVSPNRDTFTVLLRTNNPFMTDSKCRAVYTLLGNDDIKNVKKVLRIKD